MYHDLKTIPNSGQFSRRQVAVKQALFILCCVLAGTRVSAQVALPAGDAEARRIVEFSEPPTFVFGQWEDKIKIEGGGCHLAHSNGSGGFGYSKLTPDWSPLDLAEFAHHTPVLTLAVGAANQAHNLGMVFQDGDGTEHTFSIRLQGLEPGKDIAVAAADGTTLAEPGSKGKPGTEEGFDLSKVANIVFVGEWVGRPVDITLKSLALAPPTAESAAALANLKERQAQEAERRRVAAEKAAERKAALLAAAPHPEDGAVCLNLATVAPDILGIEIQSRTFVSTPARAYEPQPDDVIVESGTNWVARNGGLALEPTTKTLQRPGADGRPRTVGGLSYDGKTILGSYSIEGTALDTSTVDETVAYEIRPVTNGRLGEPFQPVAVFRKSKPNTIMSGANYGSLHKVYLKFPMPLAEGAEYEIRFKGVNTRDEKITYRHNSRTVRSEAIHNTHIGYRPADPFKRAYFSIWLGTGGALKPDAGVTRFEILDNASGKTVFTGEAVPAVRPEAEKDYMLTDTLALDFSAFRTPGEYRVFVPGIGCGRPFRIADDVWREVYRTGMRGILAQRSGIALGKPFLDYERPRPAHPDDGVEFFQLDDPTTMEGERGEALVRLWKEKGRLEKVTGVWGGYQDAGDWDIYWTSLSTAEYLIEAYEIAPDAHKRLRLALPPAEASDAIPDILNEALWGVDAFRRLQLPDGSVRTGFGQGWGARAHDLSWSDSNPVAVGAPALGSTLMYAAVAARAAAVLAPFDAARSADLAASAAKAWDWATAQPRDATPRPTQDAAPWFGELKKWLAARHHEAHAAVALYALTREPKYHAHYQEICEIVRPLASVEYQGGWLEPFQQASATFLYARLPDALADANLKRNAIALHRLAGNVAIAYMEGNPLNLATVNPGYPMGAFCAYFTLAGMGPHVVRAHHLTGDPRVLAAVVASTGYTLGANPENMTFTTGLGPNPVRFPLHLDSIRTGQPAPAGLTIYGPSDQRKPQEFSSWVYQWFITPQRVTPAVTEWPPAESYYDIYVWPAENEYTVATPVAATTYTWAYLATLAE